MIDRWQDLFILCGTYGVILCLAWPSPPPLQTPSETGHSLRELTVLLRQQLQLVPGKSGDAVRVSGDEQLVRRRNDGRVVLCCWGWLEENTERFSEEEGTGRDGRGGLLCVHILRLKRLTTSLFDDG